MKVDYVLAVAVLGALYLAVKQFLPDFPISDAVFQTVGLWLVMKLGIEVVGTPAATIRKFFGK